MVLPRALAKYLAADVVGSILLFPVWWYTKGTVNTARWIWQRLSWQAKGYVFGIWLRNFFVPMYGQHDLAGRVMSVFMRFVVLVGRVIAIMIMTVFYAVLFLLWLLLPVGAIYLLVLNGVHWGEVVF